MRKGVGVTDDWGVSALGQSIQDARIVAVSLDQGAWDEAVAQPRWRPRKKSIRPWVEPSAAGAGSKLVSPW